MIIYGYLSSTNSAARDTEKSQEKKKAKLDTRQTEKKELLASLEEERSIAQSRFNDAQLKHQDLKNKVENHERDVRRAENGIESVQARIENRTKLTGQAKKNITEFRNYVESVEIELSKNKELKLEADQSLKKAEEAEVVYFRFRVYQSQEWFSETGRW